MTRVLIADDEPRIRLLLRLALAAGGYDVIEAADGEQAVVQLRAHRPAVAVLDIQMPHRSGLEVCRAIRADAATASTSVVIATANGLDEDRRAAADAGADRYLTKPYLPSQLLAVVAELSGRGAAA
jgi:DNA-binding response OmpR family regulator